MSRLYCQALIVRYFALQKSLFIELGRAYIAKRWKGFIFLWIFRSGYLI